MSLNHWLQNPYRQYKISWVYIDGYILGIYWYWLTPVCKTLKVINYS